jgi:hypothetical protein
LEGRNGLEIPRLFEEWIRLLLGRVRKWCLGLRGSRVFGNVLCGFRGGEGGCGRGNNEIAIRGLEEVRIYGGGGLSCIERVMMDGLRFGPEEGLYSCTTDAFLQRASPYLERTSLLHS